MRMYSRNNKKSKNAPCVFCLENNSKCRSWFPGQIPIKTRLLNKACRNGVSYVLSNVSDIKLNFMLYSPYSLKESLTTVLARVEGSNHPRLKDVSITNIPYPTFQELVDELDLSIVDFQAVLTLLVDEDVASISTDIDSYIPKKNVKTIGFTQTTNICKWIEFLVRKYPAEKAERLKDL